MTKRKPLSAKDVGSYLCETLERGLKHEPFTLTRETVERIDSVDPTDIVLYFYNGQRFTVTISEEKQSV